jgi:hypothetical protein
MGRRIAVVLPLGTLVWLFVVRPATRSVALADVCCPQRCMDACAAARAEGKQQMSALMEVYRDGGTCGGG